MSVDDIVRYIRTRGTINKLSEVVRPVENDHVLKGESSGFETVIRLVCEGMGR